MNLIKSAKLIPIEGSVRHYLNYCQTGIMCSLCNMYSASFPFPELLSLYPAQQSFTLASVFRISTEKTSNVPAVPDMVARPEFSSFCSEDNCSLPRYDLSLISATSTSQEQCQFCITYIVPESYH